MRPRAILAGLVAGGCVGWAPASAVPRATVVVCAPGYPGTTQEAQPTMDELAGALERAAGRSAGRIAAVYHPTPEGGVEALSGEFVGLAIAPLAFYLEHRERLALKPLLQVAQAGTGPAEVWSLVARRGAIDGPGALEGWELAGTVGYSPRFVRRVVLAEWGEPPAGTRMRFSSRMLSVLREVGRGEPVAALLDRAQTTALDALPFAADLEVVARSRPLVGTLLCRVGGGLPEEPANELKRAFLALETVEGGRALLDTLRISGFEAIDADELGRIERAFAAGAATGP